MNEPSIDFWDEFQRQLEISEYWRQKEHEEQRRLCQKMTPEERQEAMDRAMKIIYCNP